MARDRLSPATLRALITGALILAAAIWIAWAGFGPQVMGDYPGDYAPSMDALLAGHVGAFFMHLPTNGAGGSVLLRAPFALIGKLLTGDQHGIFRFGALACMLSAAALGLALARELRAAGRSALARGTVVGLLVLTPAVLDAVIYGHPEEPLGAALCVAAVLLAARQRAEPAGLVLGLAIINKPWGVLAVFPVLLAAPRQRVRLIVAAASIAGAWTAAAYAASPEHFSRTVLGASTSIVAHPVDLWWPLDRLRLGPGVTPTYFPPRPVSDHARELAVLLSVPLALPLARRRARAGAGARTRAPGWGDGQAQSAALATEALALLALLFLLRCVLDPSNHVYYQVPFVFALAAWEARTRGLPVLALASLAGFWLVFHTIAGTGSLTAQYIGYMAVAVPVGVVLAMVVLRGGTGIVPQRDRHRIGRGLSGSVAP